MSQILHFSRSRTIADCHRHSKQLGRKKEYPEELPFYQVHPAERYWNVLTLAQPGLLNEEAGLLDLQ